MPAHGEYCKPCIRGTARSQTPPPFPGVLLQSSRLSQWFFLGGSFWNWCRDKTVLPHVHTSSPQRGQLPTPRVQAGRRVL